MLVVVRAIHYLAMAQLGGGLAFAAFIAPRRVAEGELSPAFARRLRALLRASAWIALLSWLVWLVPVAADMAGVSVSGLHGELLRRVVMATDFGHVWLWRVLLSVLVICLLAPSATPLMEARRRVAAALIVAGVTVAALALSGHAAAQIGSTKVASLASDAVHLLAGGTWLGSLLPFSIALLTTPGTVFGYGLARRFSWLGIACVVLIIASGIWNSSYLVGSWAALFATNYGHWLLFKLALVASMLMLALRNRRMT